jgi:hypothetical protein
VELGCAAVCADSAGIAGGFAVPRCSSAKIPAAPSAALPTTRAAIKVPLPFTPGAAVTIAPVDADICPGLDASVTAEPLLSAGVEPLSAAAIMPGATGA